MAEEKIVFRRTRYFGENLSDTFLFIRQNAQPLLKSFTAICALFILTQAICEGLFQSGLSQIWKVLLSGRGFYGPGYVQPVLGINYYLLLALKLLSFSSMQVAVASYIKFYVDNNGAQPGIDEVWEIFKKYFFRVFLYMIPIGFTIALGLVLCVIPGIYFWVVFVPFSMVAVIEDLGFIDTYYRCFYLVKENFWISLGIYLVALIIYYCCSILVGLSVSIIVGAVTYLTTKSLGATLGLLTSVLNVFVYFFNIIFMVSAALHYFNLVESKEGPGILDRIDSIGDNPSDYNKIDEQY